jgi:hypothetical protein
VDPFHRRLARAGLAVARRYGFALAGGYAVQAAGLLERPSDDLDLFTALTRRDEFSAAGHPSAASGGVRRVAVTPDHTIRRSAPIGDLLFEPEAGEPSGTADGVNRRLFNRVVVAIMRAYRRAGAAPGDRTRLLPLTDVPRLASIRGGAPAGDRDG